MNRRDFCSLIALAPAAVNERSPSPADKPVMAQDADGFPQDTYTPFGYLDNPWHTWDLHQSGVLRSLPGIGFSLFYPAGPGGYFSYSKNAIYEVQLALEFDISGRVLSTSHDFTAAGLSASHHSKNLLAYDLNAGGLHLQATFVQVNEDAIGVLVELLGTGDRTTDVRMLARHTCQLGPATWWGRDGLAGGFDPESDTLWVRSFAGGPVFAVASDRASQAQFLGAKTGESARWLQAQGRVSPQTSYYPEPMHGALQYEMNVGAGERRSAVVVLARSENKSTALAHARMSAIAVREEIARKRAEDAEFWNSAPRLTGDWPAYWKRGWVYDFETLRMMVRRPAGLYKHAWDAMQIQAPRNVLAETSIDMWALSYADSEAAKAVFLGQFQDAIEANVPCMREDGSMNMVAADGSECGTSISWCYPFFCAQSIFNRTWDIVWLRSLYPHLAALLRWTLANRTDTGGFLVGKCSWETGMDASKRFLIEQPTGGELTEFVRLVELQAAAAHAGSVLARFARLLGDGASIQEWQEVNHKYAERTQELWKDGWFRDFDTRSMKLVTSVSPDPAQSAPAFCNVATPDQKEQMRSTLKELYNRSLALGQKPAQGWDDGLAWSSLVLPYIESIWATGDRALASQVVATIAERIYTSMDRRVLGGEGNTNETPKLGWPGISCEIWGAHGAFGGEGYGWGAVMPAHITRSLVGIRETDDLQQIWICPNLPESFLIAGKEYGMRAFRYGSGGDRFQLNYRVVGGSALAVTFTCSGSMRPTSVLADGDQQIPFGVEGNNWQFHGRNGEQYLLRLSGRSR